MSDNDEKLALFFLLVCGFGLLLYFMNKSFFILMIAILGGFLSFHFFGKGSNSSGIEGALETIFLLASIIVLGWWIFRELVSQQPELLQCCIIPPMGIIFMANALQRNSKHKFDS